MAAALADTVTPQLPHLPSLYGSDKGSDNMVGARAIDGGARADRRLTTKERSGGQRGSRWKTEEEVGGSEYVSGGTSR